MRLLHDTRIAAGFGASPRRRRSVVVGRFSESAPVSRLHTVPKPQAQSLGCFESPQNCREERRPARLGRTMAKQDRIDPMPAATPQDASTSHHGPRPDRLLGPDPIVRAPRSSAAPTKPWTMPSLRAPTAQSRRGPSSAWGPAPSGGARNNKNEEPMGRSSLGANRGSRSRPFDYPLKQYPSVIRVPNTSGHWIPLLQVQSDSVLSLGLENLILSSTPPA